MKKILADMHGVTEGTDVQGNTNKDNYIESQIYLDVQYILYYIYINKSNNYPINGSKHNLHSKEI